MKLNYYLETDSSYVESREISEGIVLHYDAAGNLVGIDIDNVSQKVELQKLTVKLSLANTGTLDDRRGIQAAHGWTR